MKSLTHSFLLKALIGSSFSDSFTRCKATINCRQVLLSLVVVVGLWIYYLTFEKLEEMRR